MAHNYSVAHRRTNLPAQAAIDYELLRNGRSSLKSKVDMHLLLLLVFYSPVDC